MRLLAAAPCVAVWLVAMAATSNGGNPADHHAFSGPSPSCMLNGQPCPLPTWRDNWALINSTAMMARESNVDSDPEAGFVPKHRWGLITLDNSVGIAAWAGAGGVANQSHYERTATENCARLKKAGLVRVCGIYHNVELALEWLESNRAVMDDEHVAAGWFLRYQGNKSVFNHNTTLPVSDGENITLRQYFIDWRNMDAVSVTRQAVVKQGVAMRARARAGVASALTAVPLLHSTTANKQ